MELPRTVRLRGLAEPWNRVVAAPGGLRHGHSWNPAVLTRRASRRLSIPSSPLPHPLPVPLPETLVAGLPVAFVLARLANRFPRSAVGPLQMPPAAILAAPLVRTVPEGADDHFRPPTALYRTRTAAPASDPAEGPPVAGTGLRVAGHDCPAYRSERSRSARGTASE